MASSGKRKRNDNEDASDLTIDGINTIFVKSYTGETFSLQVKGSDTIISVKCKITDKIYYLPSDEQALVFNDMVLEDVITLADYCIKKNSTLRLMRKPSGLVPIFIDDVIGNRSFGKRRWPVNVKLSDTVKDLKAQISYLENTKELVIVFNDIVLDDHCILSDFHIKRDSVLTLMHKSTSKTMEIFVKILGGETISLDVMATTTIGQVKTAIRYKKPVLVDEHEQEQVLIFNEMVLDDSSIIFDFGIKKGSTLTLMCVSKGLMQISVKTVNGMSRSFEVKPSDTIGNLKTQISDELGIPIEEQVLIFNEMVLYDSGTLADFNIKGESTLTLTRSTGLMKISVNTITGMSTSIEVKPSYTIENLKSQISDKVGIPIDKQVLIFNEMVLHDSGKLADFHIKTLSTLTLMRKSRTSMQIFVQLIDGREISLEVNPLHTIGNLRARLSEEERICTEKLGLYFDGRRLFDNRTYADCNIQNNDVIHAILDIGRWKWGNGLKI